MPGSNITAVNNFPRVTFDGVVTEKQDQAVKKYTYLSEVNREALHVL